MNKCLYNNISFNHSCSSDEIIRGFTNFCSEFTNSNHLYFRKLVSYLFCSEILGSFTEYKGKPLSNIFNLNDDTIN